MRFRITFLLSLTLVSLLAFLPHLANAALFDPIIPNNYNQCAAGWGLLIQVINNIFKFAITVTIAFVAPIMIAYSGFLYVSNPMNPSGISKAHTVLKNTVIGILIALAAWIIVDAVMIALYNGGSFGDWKALIKGDSNTFCIKQAGDMQNLKQVNVSMGTITGIDASGTAMTSTGLKYNGQAQAQIPNASSKLSALLNCISGKVPSGTVTVTSISDSVVTSGAHTMEYCADIGGCSHTVHSCHYGGRNCVGESYAVDLSGNSSAVINAANACGASYKDETSSKNHVHVSIGAQNNCGCDAGLD